MVEIFDSIKQVNANIKPYKEWHKKRQELETLRLEYAKQNPLQPDQANMADSFGKTIIESINVMDEYSQKKAEHVEEALNQFGSLVPYAGMGIGLLPIALYKMISKKSNPAIVKSLLVLPVAGFILSTVAFVISASNMQKAASRIARFQARETELKDPRNFVVYTPEQIKEAEEIAKTIENSAKEEKEPSKLNPLNQIKDIYYTIKSLFKDKESYNQWLEQSKREETERKQLLNIEPTQQQLKTAKSFQDILFRTVEKIDIASQDFSENIESLTESFTLSAPIIGGAFGGIVAGVVHLLQKLKLAPVESKFLNVLKKASTPVAALLVPLAGVFYFVSLQIEASRVGRFKAKQELIKNPYNFIYLDESELSTVQSTKYKDKSKKTILDSFKNTIKEFLQIRKDFKEYNNYKKTDKKQEDKLKTALNQINIDDMQIADAKLLQDKTFRVFEKMDEMSQRYTEDIEAGTGLVILAALPLLMGATTTAGFAVMKKFPKQTFPAMILMNVANLAGILGMSMVATKIQKQASKIGLMKAIEDIKDPRHFVDYTQEQINKAQSFEGETIHSTNKPQLSQPKVKQPEIPSLQTLQIQPVVPSLQISEMSEWMKKIQSS